MKIISFIHIYGDGMHMSRIKYSTVLFIFVKINLHDNIKLSSPCVKLAGLTCWQEAVDRHGLWSWSLEGRLSGGAAVDWNQPRLRSW